MGHKNGFVACFFKTKLEMVDNNGIFDIIKEK